jgi:hypothetical protein
LDNRPAVELYRPLEKGVIKGTFDGPVAPSTTRHDTSKAA